MTNQNIRQALSTGTSVAADEHMSDMHRSIAPADPLPPTVLNLARDAVLGAIGARSTPPTDPLPPTVLNLTRDAVQAGICAAAAYAAFLKAIAARSFDEICDHTTDRLRADLRKMRQCSDFPALFEMWCESYPPTVRSVPAHCDENRAILDIEGDVGGRRVRARVLLQQFNGQWLVDKEHFKP
jgi:hypothetical protein